MIKKLPQYLCTYSNMAPASTGYETLKRKLLPKSSANAASAVSTTHTTTLSTMMRKLFPVWNVVAVQHKQRRHKKIWNFTWLHSHTKKIYRSWFQIWITWSKLIYVTIRSTLVYIYIYILLGTVGRLTVALHNFINCPMSWNLLFAYNYSTCYLTCLPFNWLLQKLLSYIIPFLFTSTKQPKNYFLGQDPLPC